MLKFKLAMVLGIAFLTLSSPLSRTDEGMWLPMAIGNEVDLATLQQRGFKLSAADVWSDETTSLKDAILQIGNLSQDKRSVDGYGSGAFVSKSGLILTNHHVAYEAIAKLSTPSRNVVESGHAATVQADELPCRGLAVQITTSMEDVTEQVLQGITADMAPEARAQAIEAAKGRALAAAKAVGFESAAVFDMASGTSYWLVTYDIFRDVRLVYAPPAGIGEYGGDIDNWMWPRHSGDFTFLRVYVAPDGQRATHHVENVPYQPEKWLEVSTSGVKEGAFCFIMGYPGETMRYRSSTGLAIWRDKQLPGDISELKRLAARLEADSKRSERAALRIAPDLKSINNALKSYEGTLEGFKRRGLVERRSEEESRFQAWLAEDADRMAEWGDVLPTLGRMQTALLDDEAAGEALRAALGGESLLTAHAVAMNREMFAPGRLQIASMTVAKQAGAMSLADQRAALIRVLTPFQSLAESQWPASLASLKAGSAALEAFVAELVPEAVTEAALTALMGRPVDELTASTTPLDRLGVAMVQAQRDIDAKVDAFVAQVPALSRRLIEGRSAWQGKPVYPDANSTLRFTHGKVVGYAPKDGVRYHWYTTLDGVVEKHSGTAPFAAPANLLEVAKRRDFGRWADAEAGTIVTCFLSDTDITGGNSGSAIMNGKGQLVGLAFDGVWEAMTNDFEFIPELSRTISVDVRYVLWCAEKLAGMGRLIDEMTLVN